jgi:hypothetical protein
MNQMEQAKSNQSVWSLVNGLTHFATHGQELIDTNMQDHQATQLMVNAGNILGKKRFDFENSMPSAFNELRQDGAILN